MAVIREPALRDPLRPIEPLIAVDRDAVFPHQVLENLLGDVRLEDPHGAFGAIDRRCPLALVAVLFAGLPRPGARLVVVLPDAMVELAGQAPNHRLVARVREAEAAAREAAEMAIGRHDDDRLAHQPRLHRGGDGRGRPPVDDQIVLCRRLRGDRAGKQQKQRGAEDQSHGDIIDRTGQPRRICRRFGFRGIVRHHRQQGEDATMLRCAACLLLALGTGLTWVSARQPTRVVENLARGVVALRTSENAVYVSWRLLGTESPDIAFNVYRRSGGTPPVRLNAQPLRATTDFVDAAADVARPHTYMVRAVERGNELAASTPFVVPAGASIQPFLTVPLQRPEGGEVAVPAGVATGKYTYNANDASVGDLDGDGEYEIVLKWEPSNARDTASPGLSGPVLLDAYRLDGTRLWRINLGRNIRAGAHYTQFVVYDFDGDGRAEIACKTADGTLDGQGRVIGSAEKDYRSLTVATDAPPVPAGDRRFGKVLAGPEYLTVFDGRSGAALATATYVPGREPQDGWGGIGGNGGSDDNGNRVDRFLAGVAYLDGQLPSLLMARGYYGRSVIAAWDWRGGTLTERWVFDSGSAPPPYPNPQASPVLGTGQPQPRHRRRGRRRQGRDRLRRDGRG